LFAFHEVQRSHAPNPLCENFQKTIFPMRFFRLLSLCTAGSVLAAVLAWPQAQSAAKAQASVPLVLAGGTVVDVTNW
jgi:hypothetical protein